MSEECHAADGYSGSLLRPQVTNSCPCCNENTRLLAAATARIAELEREIEALCLSVKRLRLHGQMNGCTTRRFAELAGVTPTQISEWTADPIDTPPDLIRAAQQPRQTPGGGVK